MIMVRAAASVFLCRCAISPLSGKRQFVPVEIWAPARAPLTLMC